MSDQSSVSEQSKLPQKRSLVVPIALGASILAVIIAVGAVFMSGRYPSLPGNIPALDQYDTAIEIQAVVGTPPGVRMLFLFDNKSDYSLDLVKKELSIKLGRAWVQDQLRIYRNVTIPYSELEITSDH